jgi:hypothetical protein
MTAVNPPKTPDDDYRIAGNGIKQTICMKGGSAIRYFIKEDAKQKAKRSGQGTSDIQRRTREGLPIQGGT